MDRRDYSRKILDLIETTGKFERLKNDLTIKRERQLQRFLRKL